MVGDLTLSLSSLSGLAPLHISNSSFLEADWKCQGLVRLSFRAWTMVLLPHCVGQSNSQGHSQIKEMYTAVNGTGCKVLRPFLLLSPNENPSVLIDKSFLVPWNPWVPAFKFHCGIFCFFNFLSCFLSWHSENRCLSSYIPYTEAASQVCKMKLDLAELPWV